MWGQWDDHSSEGNHDRNGHSNSKSNSNENRSHDLDRGANHESWAADDDEDSVHYLETIVEESIKSARSSGGAFVPEVPFQAAPPLNEVHPAFRKSHGSVSSCYSADLPPTMSAINHTLTVPDADVSPVSSRGSSLNFNVSDTSLVSPIEGSFNVPPPRATRPPSTQEASQPFKSNDPQPGSRIPRTSAETPLSGRDRKQNTKWNKYTGEETADVSGLPSHAPKPGSQPVELQYPQLKDRTRQILAGLREREAVRKASRSLPVAADTLLDQPPQRPPWRGASGRTTLVDPVQNTPTARKGPLQPSRALESQGSYARSTVDTALESSRSPPAHQQQEHQQDQYQYQDQHQYFSPPSGPPSSCSSSPDKTQLSLRSAVSEESIKPVAPLKPRNVSGTLPPEPQSTHHQPSVQQAADPQGGLGISHLQTPSRQKYSFEPDSSPAIVTATVPRKAVNTDTPTHTVAQFQHQPASRLSWTTYASTEVNNSPKSVAHTTVASPPTPPRQLQSPAAIRKRITESAQARSPYLNEGFDHSPMSMVSRKPVASGQPRSKLVASNMAAKSLPPTPIELEAADKISSLEARLEDLARRRRNNAKINRELTANLAKNAIVYDMKKRKEVEKSIADLGLELDEIGREEHEVSLILHRARKKRDRDSFYENPTGLWVRRVTS